MFLRSNTNYHHFNSNRHVELRFFSLCFATNVRKYLLQVCGHLLFDYVIAFYPILLTIFIYIGIELHDRNVWIFTYVALPVKKFFKFFRTNWNPKTTILNTCATFIILAYSKLLFTSVSLLLAVRSYNSYGDVVPDSTVLFYDPTIRFFHSEHCPYAVLAMAVIVVFVFLPPLFLLFYPTRLFRMCLYWYGFQRWDILHLLADIFQGWFNDGTEGTRDYRAVSALYLCLRVGFGSVFIVLVMNSTRILAWYVVGVLHIFLGTFFFIAKPYKKNWMNSVDGMIMVLIGVLLLINVYETKVAFVTGIVFGLTLLIVNIFFHACNKCVQMV